MASSTNSPVFPAISVFWTVWVSVTAMSFVSLPSLTRTIHAAFSAGVLQVVALSTEKKMVWIDAGWVIAFMTDENFVGLNWAVMQYP
jgi:hypothetical protein